MMSGHFKCDKTLSHSSYYIYPGSIGDLLHRLVVRLQRTLQVLYSPNLFFFLLFLQVKCALTKAAYLSGMWMIQQTRLRLFCSNAAWIDVWKLYFSIWFVTFLFSADRQVKELPFGERLIEHLTSNMPCC